MMSSAAGLRETSGLQAIAPSTLPGLRSEWEELWREAPDPSPFLSPAWLLAWEAAYAPGKVHAVAVRDDRGRLAALLPVFAWNGELLLAGTGPSDHGGLLHRPGWADCAGSMMAAAASLDLPFRRVDFRQLLPSCPLVRADIPAVIRPGESCQVLEVAGTDGMDHVPSRTRANWRYAMRRASREDGTVERVGAEGQAEVLDALADLHRRRWAERGEPGVLSGARMQALLHAAAPKLAEQGSLLLLRLAIEGRTIAVLFAMRSRSEVAYFIGGFDPAYARLSPGAVLIGAAIQEAAAQGAARFDFLRGSEAYKRNWGAIEQERVRRIVTARR